MTKIMIKFILLLPLISLGANIIQETYENGTPKSIIYTLNERPTKQISYYPDGSVQTENSLLVYKNQAVLHGITETFYPKGFLKERGQYFLGNPVHLFETFYPNRSNKSLTSWERGVKEGKEITFFENGNKQSESYFSKGVLEGEVTKWYESGSIKSKRRFRDGLLEGTSTFYYPSKKVNPGLKAEDLFWEGLEPLPSDFEKTPPLREGSPSAFGKGARIKQVQEFRMGRPFGRHVTYYPNQKERYSVTYQNGKKQGVERFFREDGKLLGEGFYQNGTPIDRHYKKHPNGNFSYLANYDKQGTLRAPIVEFDESGNKIKTYTVQNDQLNGEYLEWYPNKQLHKQYRYKQGILEGVQQEFHNNGQLKFTIDYQDNEPDGLYQQWHPTAVLASKIPYKKGVLNGKVAMWHPNGKLAQEVTYKKGLKEGAMKKWNNQGELIFETVFQNDLPQEIVQEWYDATHLKRIAEYKNGKLDGTEVILYQSGQIAAFATYKEGKYNGDLYTWYETGAPHLEQHFEMGVPQDTHLEYKLQSDNGDLEPILFQVSNFEGGRRDGKQITFHPNEKIASENEYNEGILDGKQSRWDEEETLIEEANYRLGKLEGPYFLKQPDGTEMITLYKNNLRHGTQTIFHPTKPPQNAFEIIYKNGQKHGPFKEWYRNGNLLIEGNYKAGKREGTWKTYDPYGRLFSLQIFENDRLIKETKETSP